MNKPKLIIVDNNLTFQQSLSFLLNVEGKVDVIGRACYGFEFDELLSSTTPDLILLDIDNPYINGIEIVRKALKAKVGLKIIAFTMFRDENYINRMIELGVVGFIQKSSAVLSLENDIHTFIVDEKYSINSQLLNNINKLLSNELVIPVVMTNQSENDPDDLYKYN
jgi:DNA-binding NarL/FixJ family response regulator